jgi:hypothetical protein
MERGIACRRSGRAGPEALRAAILPHRPERAIWQWGFIERLANGLRYKEVGPEEIAPEFLAVAEAWAEVETV